MSWLTQGFLNNEYETHDDYDEADHYAEEETQDGVFPYHQDSSALYGGEPINIFPDPKPIPRFVGYLVAYLGGIITGIVGYLIVGL